MRVPLIVYLWTSDELEPQDFDGGESRFATVYLASVLKATVPQQTWPGRNGCPYISSWGSLPSVIDSTRDADGFGLRCQPRNAAGATETPTHSYFCCHG